MINVLIVDDSAVVRQLLEFIMGSDPEIMVIGTARDGEEAVRFMEQKKPDLITMDINMPRMDGFEATRRIMETTPVPIIIVTGSENIHEIATSFRAMEAGAVAILARPKGVGHSDFETSAKALVEAVKTYAEIRVVRRYPRKEGQPSMRTSLKAKMKVESKKECLRVIAIGASTGGPVVLQTLLSGLKNAIPVPVLVVQHMTDGFGEGFVEWLRETTGFPVHIASDGEPLLPGHAYIARDGHQMGVAPGDRIRLAPDPAENGVRPSVSFLFRSVREVYGDMAIAILLTGMGRDGADELRLLKDAGAVTIVQDEQSSVVHGMPGEAIKLGAAMYVLSPEKIVDVVKEIANNGRNEHGSGW